MIIWGRSLSVERALEGPFNDFDYEMLSVFSEQVVTAMKNLQLHQEHEKIILGSIASIGNLLKKQTYSGLTHPPVYMEIVKMLGLYLKVNSEGIKQLEYASLLHDIGIIDVPYEILSKRGKLSPRNLNSSVNTPRKASP